MSRQLTVLAVLAALFAVSTAQQCLAALPPAREGEHCDSDVRKCQFDLFCNKNSVCAKRLDIGATCEYVNRCTNPNSWGTENCPCVPSASCRGVDLDGICVENSGPGGVCSKDADSKIATCGNGLSCGFNNTCTGGQLGDPCIAVSDPLSSPCESPLTCTNGVCTGLDKGKQCSNSDECKPGLVCIPVSFDDPLAINNKTCTDPIAAGSVCNAADQCEAGSYCQQQEPNDSTDTKKHCVPLRSVTVGGYCAYHLVCQEDLFCVNGRCAKNQPSQCMSSSDCDTPYECRCGNEEMLSSGVMVGTCNKRPCVDELEKFRDCAAPACRLSAVSQDQLTYNSCIKNNCDTDHMALLKCSPASTLSVSILAIVAAFVVNKLFVQM